MDVRVYSGQDFVVLQKTDKQRKDKSTDVFFSLHLVYSFYSETRLLQISDIRVL